MNECGAGPRADGGADPKVDYWCVMICYQPASTSKHPPMLRSLAAEASCLTSTSDLDLEIIRAHMQAHDIVLVALNVAPPYAVAHVGPSPLSGSD